MKLFLAGMAALSLSAQPYLDALKKPVLSDEDRRSMMFSYVDRHLPQIEIPVSKDQWEQRRVRLRREILQLVGLEDLDKRGPVRWVTKGKLERDAYAIEKILFESYPGMMIPALVYLPKIRSGRVPAMITIPGHVYCEGKLPRACRHAAPTWRCRGIIAMTYDYIDTGERNTGANACASMPYGGGNDHGLRRFSYTAGNPTGLEILDGIRALDYLYGRADVDRNKIGFTGESGGSNSTYWVNAIDERVKLSVPVCSVTTFDYWIRNDRNWDWHQRPPGIRRIAEISTLLALAAPRPTLVVSSLRGTDSEEFPLDQAEKAIMQAREAYRLYGAQNTIELRESSTAHGYQQDKREQMYGFVEHYFLGRKERPSPELPFMLEPRPGLQCHLPESNKTLADIYREWLNRPTPVPELPRDHEGAVRVQDKLREQLRQLLGLPDPAKTQVSIQSVGSRGYVLMRQLVIEPEEGIRIPAIEISPRQSSPAGHVLIPGKSADWPGAISALLSQGLAVTVFDPRATGEIDSGGGRMRNWAWFVGRPLPGAWARDIQAAVNAAAAEHPGQRIGLVAVGQFAHAGLFAAALDPRIIASTIRLPAASFRDDAERDEIAAVPRILAYTDLPIVTALLAPRACRLEFPHRIETKFREAYDWTARFYKHGFQSAEFDLVPTDESDWNAAAKWFAQALR